ncbi:MAG TPA: gliding motility protein, partial [Flavobacterium sp.]|nr:gliding motility protein [Flavobacterium sp.]
RYHYILGQLYQELGYKDSAVASYQSVIDLNRKAERKFVIQAHAKKAELFDYQTGDSVAFVKTFDKLIQDRENRPYKDLIFHHMAVFQDKENNQKAALNFYNASLRTNSKDTYLVASNYRNLGNMYFRNAEYPVAAKYYDSTLVKLNVKTREFVKIQKIRSNLDEVILYEAVAKRNDSILNVVAMNPENRMAYFEKYIAKLKEEDAVKKLLVEKNKAKQENIARNNSTLSPTSASIHEPGKPMRKSAMAPPTMAGVASQTGASTFYFYNPTTVAFGKMEFKKIWGDRTLNTNWRVSSGNINAITFDSLGEDKKLSDKEAATDKIVEQYTTDFYLKQLPSVQKELDSIHEERNFAYYQLGVIYKEKFKENNLALDKLEKLLQQNPQEKLILPAMYNLYKLYQIADLNKVQAIQK